MALNSSRRWLRFSLRALLVAITLCCGWLAWERHVVVTRLAVRKTAEQRGFKFTNIPSDVLDDRLPARISLVRQWLGDEPIHIIWYNLPFWGTSQEDAEALLSFFPEAEVQEEWIHMSPRAEQFPTLP
jgi:hypothetical protein